MSVERKRQPVRGAGADQRLPNQRSVSEYRATESSASCRNIDIVTANNLSTDGRLESGNAVPAGPTA